MSKSAATLDTQATVRSGKPISQARKDAIDARWGEVITKYPPELRGRINQYRVALRNAALDTDALDELIAVHGGVLNHGL